MWKAYNCLRRHSSIFYILLLNLVEQLPPINDSSLNKSHIKTTYNTKVHTSGENYKNANEQFSNKLDKNSYTYSEDLIDFFHKKNKISSDSSSSNIIDKAVKNTKDVTTNIANKIYDILGL